MFALHIYPIFALEHMMPKKILILAFSAVALILSHIDRLTCKRNLESCANIRLNYNISLMIVSKGREQCITVRNRHIIIGPTLL